MEEHPVAFPARHPGNSELHLFEVSQPAVNQLGRLGRGPCGHVPAVHEERSEAALGSVERDAAAGNAATDHQQVEGVAPQGILERFPGRKPKAVVIRLRQPAAQQVQLGGVVFQNSDAHSRRSLLRLT